MTGVPVPHVHPVRGPRLNLNFHGIGVPRGRAFGDGERDFWVSEEILEDVLDAAGGREDVSVSFDDGNTTDIEVALPALLARRLTATFFIVPGWLGRPGFIRDDDVRALVASGMTIGNHGMAHEVWTKLTPDRLDVELSEGRRQLERLTESPVDTVAIPYGAYDASVLGTLRRHAYAHVFTSDGGVGERDAWLQPREHLRADHNAIELARLLASVGSVS